jgi:hypothetical protein
MDFDRIENYIIYCIYESDINYMEVKNMLDELLLKIFENKIKMIHCLIEVIKKYRIIKKFDQDFIPVIPDLKQHVKSYINKRQKALLYWVEYNPLYRRDYDEYIEYIEELSKPLQKLDDDDKFDGLKKIYKDEGLVYMKDLINKVYPKDKFMEWEFNHYCIWLYIIKEEYYQNKISLENIIKYISYIPDNFNRVQLLYELLVYEYESKGKSIEELKAMITQAIIPNDYDRDNLIDKLMNMK